MDAATEPSSAAKSATKIPIVEVAFKKGMWWAIPPEMSQQLYDHYLTGEDAGYTWDWGTSRLGSWSPEGEETSVNRYVIDFTAKEQTNIDNDRRRTVRIVWVDPTETTPRWTGEIPQ